MKKGFEGSSYFEKTSMPSSAPNTLTLRAVFACRQLAPWILYKVNLYKSIGSNFTHVISCGLRLSSISQLVILQGNQGRVQYDSTA